MRLLSFMKHKSPLALTFVATAGVVATAISAAKATRKVGYIFDLEMSYEDGELTMDAKKELAKGYIPTVAIGVGTVVAIFGIHALNQKQQASIIGAYHLTKNAFDKYKDKVLELVGEEKEEEVRHSIIRDNYEEQKVSDGKMLFYETISEHFFESTMEDVILAAYHFNRNFALRGGQAYLNEFYEFLGIPTTDEGYILEWDIHFDHGYQWVDFRHEEVELAHVGTCIAITYPFEPTICEGPPWDAHDF